MQYFCLLVSNRVRVKRDWRFHRSQADQLHDVIWHHVAQRSGLIVVTAALFHAHGFRHRNLHVIDVAPVPDGLEDSVGESKRQDVLDRFLAQIMIDAIDLLFFRNFQQLHIQVPGRLQVMTKGFLDDHPPPVLVVLFHKPGFSQVFDDGAEKTRGGRQVEEVIAVRGMVLVYFLQQVFQLRVDVLVVELGGHVIHTAEEPFDDVLVAIVARVVLYIVGQFLAEIVGGHRGMRDSHDGEFARQQVGFGEVVERGNELAAGQITSCAKNDHYAGVGGFRGALWLGVCHHF